MRLPYTYIKEVRESEGSYSATLEVTLWPGLVKRVPVARLVRCPDRASCNRLERLPYGVSSYVVTLYSRGEPFASVYLEPIWSRQAR